VAGPKIPQRIAPLSWRNPAILWTPLALFVAVGWPAILFVNEPELLRAALLSCGGVFAIALITLSASWAIGKPPRARRHVVLHVVAASVIAAFAAPLALTRVLAAVAESKAQGAGDAFTFSMSLAMTPLAMLLGLPVALISGVLFAWIALDKARVGDGDLLHFKEGLRPFQ
jgi:hypothetical protein